MMYRKGEVSYQALPLPDRVQLDEAGGQARVVDFLAFLRKRSRRCDGFIRTRSRRLMCTSLWARRSGARALGAG